MIHPAESIIIQLVSRAMVPLLQIFGLYVIVHGHYGPGGGFQGGVILGVSIILLRLYSGTEAAYRKFPPNVAYALAAIGMLIFILAGFIPMANGGMFLDYAHLPIPGVPAAELRYLGILIVEAGIGMAVFGTMVLIFDNLILGKR